MELIHSFGAKAGQYAAVPETGSLPLVMIHLFKKNKSDQHIEQDKRNQDPPVLQHIFGGKGIIAVRRVTKLSGSLFFILFSAVSSTVDS